MGLKEPFRPRHRQPFVSQAERFPWFNVHGRRRAPAFAMSSSAVAAPIAKRLLSIEPSSDPSGELPDALVRPFPASPARSINVGSIYTQV